LVTFLAGGCLSPGLETAQRWALGYSNVQVKFQVLPRLWYSFALEKTTKIGSEVGQASTCVLNNVISSRFEMKCFHFSLSLLFKNSFKEAE